MLFSKLGNLGLGQIALNWLKSYLDLIKIVRFNGGTSSKLKVISSIPQGPILRPTIFIYYMNDIFDQIKM